VRASQLRNHWDMTVSVYSRALRRAAELLGGREKLVKLLQIPAADLDSWIADRILDETTQSGDGGTTEPPASRDAAGSSTRYLD